MDNSQIISSLPFIICFDLNPSLTSMKERNKIKEQILNLTPKRTIIPTIKSTTELLISDKDNLNYRNALKYKIPIINKEILLSLLQQNNNILSNSSDSNSDNIICSLFDDDFDNDFNNDNDYSSDSTDFSFTSSYSSISNHYSNNNIDNDNIIDNNNDSWIDFDNINDFSDDEDDNDENYLNILRNSATIESNTINNNNNLLRLNAWEVGTNNEPYFPSKTQEESSLIHFYCPKSFLLKQTNINQNKWCLLQLQFCEEIIKSCNILSKGQLKKQTYYRITEKEYYSFDSISDAMEYHYHTNTLEEAQNYLYNIYNHKIENDNYYRVSVFQTQEEKKMVLCSPSLLTTPFNHLILNENNISSELYEFVISLLDHANTLISQHFEELKLNAVGTLITPTGAPITLTEITKSEKILYDLSKILYDIPTDKKMGYRIPRDKLNKIHQLSKEYYNYFGQSNSIILSDLKQISEKFELSQLLRDMMLLGEETTAFQSIDEKALAYRSLRCRMDIIPQHKEEYINISSNFLVHLPEGSNVHRIISICRPSETELFTDWVNKKSNKLNEPIDTVLLYHGSKMEYWYSILARGLLIPSIDPLQQIVPRTDPGMLGYGLYFSSDPNASIQYSDNCEGRRLMLVCQVALGNIYESVSSNSKLVQPPTDFDSIHGIKSTPAMNTEFINDEYVIYNLAQQRMRYIIEYSLPKENKSISIPPSIPLFAKKKDRSSFINSTKLQISDTNISINKPINYPSGLIITTLESYIDQPCTLNQVRIFGNIIDSIGEISIYQEFTSTNRNIAQAKYIFPLDDMAAVCGFEAFVNGKHIVGSVKEKEQAKHIYEEAVDKGYGAYLMTQQNDDRDLFCINIGNILPLSNVIIKITYVTELQLESNTNNLILSLPQEIRQSSLGTESSSILKSSSFLLQLSIIMPYDILNINSNVESYECKQTRTKASLRITKVKDNEPINIIISIENATEPRLFIEQNENGHYAAMLSICPNFLWTPPPITELIFIIDRSASMQSKINLVQFTLQVIIDELLKLASNKESNTSIRFNIIGFGASFEWLFVNSQDILNSNAKNKVFKYIEEELYADLGGSDLWLPLNAAYLLSPLKHSNNSKIQRSLYILTDGLINQESYTRELIKENAIHTRVFTIGIGNDLSKTSINYLAKIGGGTAIYIYNKHQAYKTVIKISNQLNQALQPSWRNIEVNWGLPGQQEEYNLSNPMESFQSPHSIRSLYQGERILIFYLGNTLYTSATIKAKANKSSTVINSLTSYHTQSINASDWWKDIWEDIDQIVSTHEMAVTKGSLIHKLAVRSVLHEWESGTYFDNELSQQIQEKNLQQSIIDLSIQYQLITKFTAFVAIEERLSDDDLTLVKSTDLDIIWNNEISDILDELSWETVINSTNIQQDHKMKEEDSESDDDFWDSFLGIDFDSDNEKDDICDIVDTIEAIKSNIPSGILLPKDYKPTIESTIKHEKPSYQVIQPQKSTPKVKERFKTAKYTKPKTHNITYSGYTRRSGGAVNSLLKQNEIEKSILENSNNKQKYQDTIFDNEIITPFGFKAIPKHLLPLKIKNSISNNDITHLFKAPLNTGGDCWLNAVLMLCFSMESFRTFIHHFTSNYSSYTPQQQLRIIQKANNNSSISYNNKQGIIPSLIISLEAIISCWNVFSNNNNTSSILSTKKANRFRESLFVAQKRLLQVFKNLGFNIKDPQCAIHAFHIIEDQMRIAFLNTNKLKKSNNYQYKSNLSWISLSINSWELNSSHWKLLKKKSQNSSIPFFILCNRDYSELPFDFILRNNSLLNRLSMNGFSLYSFISFEIIDNITNHYKTIVLTNNGFILYNDILHIGTKSGGYQGTIYNITTNKISISTLNLLKQSCKMVPICIFYKTK